MSQHYFCFGAGGKTRLINGPLIPRVGEHVILQVDGTEQRFRVTDVVYRDHGDALAARVYPVPTNTNA
jgi:hypothetical protein